VVCAALLGCRGTDLFFLIQVLHDMLMCHMHNQADNPLARMLDRQLKVSSKWGARVRARSVLLEDSGLSWDPRWSDSQSSRSLLNACCRYFTLLQGGVHVVCLGLFHRLPEAALTSEGPTHST